MMRFSGRGRRQLPVNAEINLTNLIDVAFVLLIIFMITAPILQGGIEVTLPDAEARPLDAKEPVTVSIDRDGQYYVEKAKVASIAELETVLRTYTGGETKRSVVLSADQAANWGAVVQVLAIGNKLDLEIGAVVEQRTRR